MDPSEEREFGALSARMNTLEREMREVKTDITTILKTLNEARGGWKTLLLVGGVAGAAGALLGKLVGFIKVG